MHQTLVPHQSAAVVTVHARTWRRVGKHSKDIAILIAVAETCITAVQSMPEGRVTVDVSRTHLLAIEPHERVVVHTFEVYPSDAIAPFGWKKEVLPIPLARKDIYNIYIYIYIYTERERERERERDIYIYIYIYI